MNETSVAVSGASGAPVSVNLLETPSAGSPPLRIAASVSILGGSGSYPTVNWNFGDGGTGSGSVVSHTYPGIGDFNVTVSVADSGGTTAKAVAPVHVAGLLMSISVSPASGDAPLNVTGSASIQGGTGSYSSVRWTWGDGTSSSGSPLNHSYAANVTGNVTIHAAVNDSAGTLASATTTVSIVGGPVATLVAEVPTGSIFPISVNLSLTVTGETGSFQPNPLWDFGDGSTTRGPSPQDHQYVKPGSFHVSVTTNDSSGVVATASTWVNLSAGVPAGSQNGGTPPEWVFNGVANPDQAALGLMGFVAGTGLAMLLYKRFVKGHRPGAPPTAPPTPMPRIPSAASPSSRGLP
jgi:PKD repeat protein